MEISELIPKDGFIQRLYCEQCGSHMKLIFDKFDDHVSGVNISINNLPYLHCQDCDIKHLPDRSRIAIVDLHRRASNDGHNFFRTNRQKVVDNFNLTKIAFLYDPDDYYYIPGLFRHHNSGFLTPVFFNKAVLLKFQNHTDYRVSFASKTYGTVYMEEDYISFGLNDSGRVIMWLGDLAKLPENEQYYLRSENVPSDHEIGSEFYDAQIEVRFTDYSPEDKLIQARTQFLDFCFREFGHELSHLTDETLEAISELAPPVLHTKKEQKDIVDLLNKINVESLDSKLIGRLISESGGNPSNLGSLKKLEMLLTRRFPEIDISRMMSPLFVLYDMRVSLLHATSVATKKERMASARERLGLAADADFDAIYPALIHQLTECYENLAAQSSS